MPSKKGIDGIEIILNDYSDEVRDAVKTVIVDVTENAAKKLRSAGSFGGKKYRKSWKSMVEKTRVGVSGTVYNEKYYRLTHLLEYGHAKRKGGRTRAFPHIAEVNSWAQTEAQKKIEEAVKG